MKYLLTLIALPIAAYCQQAGAELFSFAERESESLRHIEFDSEVEENFDETQSLSLFEIDESDESLAPWSADSLACEEFADLLSGKKVEAHEEFEDVFCYEMPCYGEGNICKPSYEKVTEERKRLFNRPRVVEASPTP